MVQERARITIQSAAITSEARHQINIIDTPYRLHR
jgi:translation elongation factor EF-G